MRAFHFGLCLGLIMLVAGCQRSDDIVAPSLATVSPVVSLTSVCQDATCTFNATVNAPYEFVFWNLGDRACPEHVQNRNLYPSRLLKVRHTYECAGTWQIVFAAFAGDTVVGSATTYVTIP